MSSSSSCYQGAAERAGGSCWAGSTLHYQRAAHLHQHQRLSARELLVLYVVILSVLFVLKFMDVALGTPHHRNITPAEGQEEGEDGGGVGRHRPGFVVGRSDRGTSDSSDDSGPSSATSLVLAQ